MRRLFIIFICIIAIYCAGCAAPGRYLKNRANDFADCFKADVGIGIGADVQVKATEYISTGIGGSTITKTGFKGRYAGNWEDQHIGFPIMSMFTMVYPFCGSTDAFAPIYVTDANRTGLPLSKGISYSMYASILFINIASSSRPIIDKFDFEVGGTALFVGARAGFSLGQFLDFVLGITGIDIANDDEKTEVPEHKEKQAPNE